MRTDTEGLIGNSGNITIEKNVDHISIHAFHRIKIPTNKYIKETYLPQEVRVMGRRLEKLKPSVTQEREIAGPTLLHHTHHNT